MDAQLVEGTTAPTTSQDAPLTSASCKPAKSRILKPKLSPLKCTLSLLRFRNWKAENRDPHLNGYLDAPMDEVLPGLFVGGMRAATDLELLKAHRVEAICTALNEGGWQRPAAGVAASLRLPVDDLPFSPIHSFFEPALRFIHEQRVRERGVLVHCFMGVSRSVTIALAYLITVLELDVARALRFVQRRRLCADPNHGFREQLREFAEKHRSTVRAMLIESFGERKFNELLERDRKFYKKYS